MCALWKCLSVKGHFFKLSLPYPLTQGYHPTDPTKTKTPLITSSPGASQTVALPSLQVSNNIGNGFVSTLKRSNAQGLMTTMRFFSFVSCQ